MVVVNDGVQSVVQAHFSLANEQEDLGTGKIERTFTTVYLYILPYTVTIQSWLKIGKVENAALLCKC